MINILLIPPNYLLTWVALMLTLIVFKRICSKQTSCSLLSKHLVMSNILSFVQLDYESTWRS
jgi:type III secretory pathway component EscR